MLAGLGRLIGILLLRLDGRKGICILEGQMREGGLWSSIGAIWPFWELFLGGVIGTDACELRHCL